MPTAQEGSTLMLASLSKVVLDCQGDKAGDRPARVGGVELDSCEARLGRLDGLGELAGLGELGGLGGRGEPVLEQP